tara:strand:+ start:282 stop:512 length:231 start_codon:yes stop_codon:yes gene_type:complete
MRQWVKEFFASYDGRITEDTVDEQINKWLMTNPSLNLIDIKYDVHYTTHYKIVSALVIYESNNEPFIDWHKGEQQA